MGGLGFWWRGFGAHLNALSSLNGVEDPLNPPESTHEEKFANLKNQFVNMGLSYEIKKLKFSYRKNFPYLNSGNDYTLTVTYRYHFDQEGSK